MIALALTLLLAAATPDATDPIGPAAQGKVQCYKPNTERKTCASTGAYTRRADGGIDNTAVVLVAANPLIVMEATSRVTMKGGAVCAPIVAADVDAARFTINGEPAPEDTAAKIKAALKGSMASLLGHEACTAFAPDGAVLRAEVSVDGKREPSMDQRVIWVSPQDGYSVGP